MNKKQVSDNYKDHSSLKLNKKRFSFRSKLIIFLLLVLFSVLASFYFYIKTTQPLKDKYNKGIKYLEKLEIEQGYCGDLLSQEGGKFGDYEYCQRLLQVFPKNNYDEKNN